MEAQGVCGSTCGESGTALSSPRKEGTRGSEAAQPQEGAALIRSNHRRQEELIESNFRSSN